MKQSTPLIIAAAVCGVGVLFWQLKKKRKMGVKLEDIKIPNDWTQIGEIEEIIIYPLKGGRRKVLTEAEGTKFGLRDRESGLLDR